MVSNGQILIYPRHGWRLLDLFKLEAAKYRAYDRMDNADNKHVLRDYNADVLARSEAAAFPWEAANNDGLDEIPSRPSGLRTKKRGALRAFMVFCAANASASLTGPDLAFLL